MNQIENIMALADAYARRPLCVRQDGVIEPREALRAAIEAALGSGEPIGWAWQHDETGRTMCNLNDGINTPEDFKKANPRWHLVSPLYRAPQPQPKPKPLFADLIAQHTGLLDELKEEIDAPKPALTPGEPVAHCKVRPLQGDEAERKVVVEWVGGKPIPGPLYAAPQPQPDDTALLRQALYLIDAWERGCDHADYWREIAALRERLA
jgi:hypothetical protein